jgi:hypothetical protein
MTIEDWRLRKIASEVRAIFHAKFSYTAMAVDVCIFISQQIHHWHFGRTVNFDKNHRNNINASDSVIYLSGERKTKGSMEEMFDTDIAFRT